MVRGPGPHYPVPGYPSGPVPARRVELWLGVYRRRGLQLVARHGDGWIPSMSYLAPDAFRTAAARLHDAVLRAGRDPAAVRRIYNLGGVITDGPVGDDPLVGPVDLWVETLTEWAVELGIDAFLFAPPDMETRGVERFATEIVPAVREAVARAGDRDT